MKSLSLGLWIVISLLATPVLGQSDGEFKGELVWSEQSQSWLSPLEFWRQYAKANGGLTWGESKTYPVYEQVKEHDKLIILLDSGPCLMEFFHSRWRRANDVRRWNPKFNEVGGCPKVFE